MEAGPGLLLVDGRRLADCRTASECSRAFMRRAATLAVRLLWQPYVGRKESPIGSGTQQEHSGPPRGRKTTNSINVHTLFLRAGDGDGPQKRDTDILWFQIIDRRQSHGSPEMHGFRHPVSNPKDSHSIRETWLAMALSTAIHVVLVQHTDFSECWLLLG